MTDDILYMRIIGTPAPSSWTGIPDPTATMGYSPITVAEPADHANWPASQATGHYYIDPSHGSATDTANTYGYPNKPRITIPSSLTLATGGGKLVLAGDGASYSATASQVTISGNGDATNQNWVVGRYTTTRTDIGNIRIISNGTYTVHNDYNISNFSSDSQCFRLSGEFSTLKNFNFGGTGTDVGNSAAVTVTSNAVVYNGVIHTFGDWQALSENDYHGVKVGNGGSINNVWVLELTGYNLGGDTVQFGDVSATNYAHHLYIGGGESYDNLENAVDIKSVQDVVISGHVAHDMQGGPGSNGTCFVAHNTCVNIYFIGNTAHTCKHGISVTGGSGVHIIGNEVRDCTVDGILYYGTAGGSSVVGNTLHNNETHIDLSDPLIVECNMMGDLAAGSSGYQLWFASTSDSDNSTVDHNFYATPMNNKVSSTVYTDIATWRSARSNDANGIEAAPLFANEGADDFTLQAGSTAVDAGKRSTIYTTFESTYGVSIEFDLNVNSRPVVSGDWDIGAYERV